MGMREMMKSTLAAFLAVGICLGVPGCLRSAQAEELEKVYTSHERYMLSQGYKQYENEDGSYFFYYMNNKKLMIGTWVSNGSDTFVVPDIIDGKPVRKVEFFTEVCAENVVLSDGIKSFNQNRVYDDMFCCYDDESLIKTITLGKSFEGELTCDGASFESLKKIKVSSKNKKLRSINGVLFSKNRKNLILYPANKKGSKYTVPKETQVIESGAFYEVKKLKKIIVPSNVKEVKSYAFEYCVNLKELVFKSRKTKINGSFDGLVYQDYYDWDQGFDDDLKKITIKAPKGSPAIDMAKTYKTIKLVTIKG